MQRFESRLNAAGPAQAKHSNEGLEECQISKVGQRLRYDREREEGKCGEGMLLGRKCDCDQVVYGHCTVGSSQRYLVHT
jgi:hypothetical protein